MYDDVNDRDEVEHFVSSEVDSDSSCQSAHSGFVLNTSKGRSRSDYSFCDGDGADSILHLQQVSLSQMGHSFSNLSNSDMIERLSPDHSEGDLCGASGVGHFQGSSHARNSFKDSFDYHGEGDEAVYDDQIQEYLNSNKIQVAAASRSVAKNKVKETSSRTCSKSIRKPKNAWEEFVILENTPQIKK